MADHYELLGVAPGASPDEIKRAYHGLARRHHPDTFSGEPDAAIDAARRRMAAINAAWTVLSDPVRRSDYDADVLNRAPRPAPPSAEADDEGVAPDFPDWFEPDPGVPAAFLEEDDGEGGTPPPPIVVFAPIALAAAALASFALGLVVASPTLLAIAVVLAPLTLVAFFTAPFVVMASRARGRP